MHLSFILYILFNHINADIKYVKLYQLNWANYIVGFKSISFL